MRHDGPPVVDDLVGHPGGERLVEPQVVPPDHRHQVAEPLVRELVRDHLGDALLHRQRRGRRVEQQRHLAEGDRARVLHRAGLEVGHADLIELAERVGEAEVVLEPRQHRGRRRPARTPSGAASRRVVQVRIGTSRDRRRRSRTSGADDQRDQVRRQRRRRREGDAAARRARRSRRGWPRRSTSRSRRSARPRRASRQIALNAGSSKQGKTRRASAASNCVTASGCRRGRARAAPG